MLYVNLGVDFFSTSELLYPNLKKIRLVRARPNSYMISDNPNVSLGIVDCSLYTRCIALEKDNNKKTMDLLAYTLVEFNYLETLVKTFIIPAIQHPFFQENIFSKATVVGLPVKWLKTLHLLDCTLKITSRINILLSDKLEYSEEVSQS